MKVGDLPHAPLPHIVVLQDAAFEAGVALAVAGQDHPVPARLGGLSVHGQVHHRRGDQLCMDRAGLQALAATAVAACEEGGDRPLPVRVILAQIEHGPVREQRSHLVPQPVLGVLGVGVLQGLDGADALGPLDVPRQTVARRRRQGRQGRKRHTNHHPPEGFHRASSRLLRGFGTPTRSQARTYRKQAFWCGKACAPQRWRGRGTACAHYHQD